MPIRSKNDEFNFSLNLNSSCGIDTGNYGGDKDPHNPIEFIDYGQNSELCPAFENPLSQEPIPEFGSNEFSIAPIFNLSELPYIPTPLSKPDSLMRLL